MLRGGSAAGRVGRSAPTCQERAWQGALRMVCASGGRGESVAVACRPPMAQGPSSSFPRPPHPLATASGRLGESTWLSQAGRARGAAWTMAPGGAATAPHGSLRLFATGRGQGAGDRDRIERRRGDEASAVFTNVARGEKLKMKDLWAIKDKQALYIKEDGSKEEMTVQGVLDEAAVQELSPVLVSGLNGGDMLVMKLMDAGRTRHDLQKKKREAAKKNAGSQSLKELRFGLHIDQNDLNTKMKQAKGFLEQGHRVRIFMQLKGKDFHQGQSLAKTRLDEIAEMVGDSGTQDGKPLMSGHVVSTTLAPKPGAKDGGSSNSAANGKKSKVKDGGNGALDNAGA